jgi:hypothetical protein
MRIKPRNKRLLVILEGTDSKTGRLSAITTKGGIHIPVISMGNYVEEGTGTEATIGIQNRWARVVDVGSLCTEIKAGDRICIFSQKWTDGFKFEDQWYWFSDEDEVLLLDLLHRETKGKKQTETEDHFIVKKMKGFYD